MAHKRKRDFGDECGGDLVAEHVDCGRLPVDFLDRPDTKHFMEYVSLRAEADHNKRCGLQRPWSENSIMNERKFCNIRRDLDYEVDFFNKHVVMAENRAEAKQGYVLIEIKVEPVTPARGHVVLFVFSQQW